MGFNKPYKAIKPMFKTSRWRIFPGDMVYVNHGPHAKQSGKVLQVIRDSRVPQVVVENVNLRKKKIFTDVRNDQYVVVTMEAPIHYSQVSLMEPLSVRGEAAQGDGSADSLVGPEDRWVRAKFRYLADGTRVRIGTGKNATGAIIPIPPQVDPASSEKRVAGDKDCKVEEAARATFTHTVEDFTSWLQTTTPPLGSSTRSRQPLADSIAARVQGTRQLSTCTASHLHHHCSSPHMINSWPGRCGTPSVLAAHTQRTTTSFAQHPSTLTARQLHMYSSNSIAVQGWLQQAASMQCQ